MCGGVGSGVSSLSDGLVNVDCNCFVLVVLFCSVFCLLFESSTVVSYGKFSKMPAKKA